MMLAYGYVFKVLPRRRLGVEALGFPGRQPHLAKRSYGVRL
jgi:hypothetical protein